MKLNETLKEPVFEKLSDSAKNLYNSLLKDAQHAANGGSKANVGYATLCEKPDVFEFSEEQVNAVDELALIGVPIVLSKHNVGFRTIEMTNIRIQGARTA